MAEELRRLGAALNRVGGNVKQVARACNEARLRGERLPYTERSHAEMEALRALVFELSRTVQALARGRLGRQDLALTGALQGSEASMSGAEIEPVGRRTHAAP